MEGSRSGKACLWIIWQTMTRHVCRGRICSFKVLFPQTDCVLEQRAIPRAESGPPAFMWGCSRALRLGPAAPLSLTQPGCDRNDAWHWTAKWEGEGIAWQNNTTCSPAAQQSAHPSTMKLGKAHKQSEPKLMQGCHIPKRLPFYSLLLNAGGVWALCLHLLCLLQTFACSAFRDDGSGDC